MTNEQNPMPELKPCPFCGEEPTQAEMWVGCQSGKCFVRPCAKYYRNISDAMRHWNTRAIEPVNSGMRDDELSEFIDKISFECETMVFNAMTRRAAPPAFMTLATEGVRAFFNSNTTLKQALQQSAWQPMETAPKDGTRILLYNGYQTCGYWTEYFNGNSQWNHGGIPITNPTYWKPLELPPMKDGD